jgi:outer membrane protein
MFKILIPVVIISFNLFASDDPLLRVNKQEIIKAQKQEIEANSQKTKYDWIAPINLSSSYTKSDTQDDFVSDSSISLNQDIFRSGGIMYKIDYANVKRENSLASLASQNTSLYKELFTGLLQLKKLKLIEKQTHFNLLNAEIEVFLKTQQYKAGDLDITELNRALRDKNSILKSELTAKQNIIEREIELKKLTDKDLSSIEIPKFELIDKKSYEEANYNLLVANLNTELSDKAYKVTRSSYLPTLSVNAAYGYTDNPNINYDDDYYRYGLRLSMPLSFNYSSTLEESRAAYLQDKLQIQEDKIDVMSLYDVTLSKIKNYEDYKLITQNNIELYSDLMEIVKQALKSGMKTGYDLKTLQNTTQADKLELEINDINIQLELAELIFATKMGENYYE